MRRIAHGEISRHRERFDARLVFDDGARYGGLVERRGLFTGRGMAALDSNDYAAAAMTAAASAIGNNNFIAVAKSNLDGDALVSTWESTVDFGAYDCTTGVY